MTINCASLHLRRRDVFRRRFHVVILATAAVILHTGCATKLEMPATPGQSANAMPAAYFSMRGRISVRVGQRIESGHIRWLKLPDEERLQVFTPFGSQVAELLKHGDGRVTLRRDGETIEAGSIRELTASVLGVSLDLDAIATWIQGVGFRESESLEKRFDSGDLWLVTVERFQTEGRHRYASRLSALSGETTVRLAIDQWQAE